MTNIIFPATVFYIFVILCMSLLGVTLGAGDVIEFPEFPKVPGQDAFADQNAFFATLVGVLLVFEFLVFILFIITFMFKMIGVNMFGLLPTWLNIIIFLPLVIVIAYEVIARFFGFGSSG